MKKILYSLLFIFTVIFTACEEDLPKASFDLYELKSLTATAGDMNVTLSWEAYENARPNEYLILWTSGSSEAEGGDEEEAAALMGAGGWTIFWKITFPHIKWALLYGVVLCTARAMGEFGAVSVLSGHLRGKTNTLPLHVEILFNEFQYVPAFAVSSLLVIMAVIILVVRSLIEYKGKKEA